LAVDAGAGGFARRPRILSIGLAMFCAAIQPLSLLAQTNSSSNGWGNLQQLYSDASGHWHNQDLTVLSGGILGAAGSSVTAVALTVGDYERLFFLDSNRHVQQFYSDASGHWHNQDLTTLSGSVLAGNGSSLTAIRLSSGDYERVFFLDSNGHVQQLWSDSSGYWHSGDLTLASGGSLAAPAGTLSAIALSSGDLERVFFLDSNGHVQQLWSDSTGHWHSGDLTLASGSAPAAAQSALTAIALSSEDFERCFFVQAYKIAGAVLTAGGTGFPGATVTLTGTTAGGSTLSLPGITDSNGNYAFSVPPGGNYTVTPSLSSYTFSPASQMFANLGTNKTQNFAASTSTGFYTISGQALVGGTGVSGVTIGLSGTLSASTTTDENGDYSFTVSAGGTYTITPSLSGYTFTPGSQMFTNVPNNRVAEPFDATKSGAGTVSISGSTGVPANGSSSYQIQVSTSDPITLTLVLNGSGFATFANGSTTTSLTSSGSVTIYGYSPSTIQNDIVLTATSPTNFSLFARLYLSVVSVQVSMRTAGNYSSDNTAATNFSNQVAGNLGTQIVNMAGQGPFCASVIEYVGAVTPSNYQGTIVLRRSYAAASFVNQQSANSSNGDDTSVSYNRVDTATAAGHVYDLDAPGVFPAPPPGVPSDIARVRQNFVEYAVLDSQSSSTLVSNQLQAFQRSSCTGIYSQTAAFANDVPGDNTAGLGTTPLTWNLNK
jgi:hypothetical protein